MMPNLPFFTSGGGGNLVADLGKWAVSLVAIFSFIKVIGSIFVVVPRDYLAIKMRFGNPLRDRQGRPIIVGSGLYLQFYFNHTWSKFRVNDQPLDLGSLEVVMDDGMLMRVTNATFTCSMVPSVVLTGTKADSKAALSALSTDQLERLVRYVLQNANPVNYIQARALAALQMSIQAVGIYGSDEAYAATLVEFRKRIEFLAEEISIHYLDLSYNVAPDPEVLKATIMADAMRDHSSIVPTELAVRDITALTA